MNMPFGLMFHHFHGGSHKPDKANSLSGGDFEKILQYIGLNNILSADEWILALKSQKFLHKQCCLTFDDGLKNQFDIALPVLQKYKLKAFWFIYSAQYEKKYPRLDIFRRFRYHFFDDIDNYYDIFFSEVNNIMPLSDLKFKEWEDYMLSIAPFYSKKDLKYRYIRDFLLCPDEYNSCVEKIIKSKGLNYNDLTSNLWLTKADLSYLSNEGHILGLHSYDHPTNLSKLNELDQKEQYLKNMIFLKNFCHKPMSMSHPCNSYNSYTLKILSEMGIKIGFRSNMGSKYIIDNYKNLQFPREDAANILINISK
jgi:peptidoglycan/xylan/chitin deacetylase (PgdA/CDA1 family)